MYAVRQEKFLEDFDTIPEQQKSWHVWQEVTRSGILKDS